MYPVHDICAPFSRVDAKERQFDNDELDYIVLLAEWVGTEIAREHQLQAMAEKLKKKLGVVEAEWLAVSEALEIAEAAE